MKQVAVQEGARLLPAGEPAPVPALPREPTPLPPPTAALLQVPLRRIESDARYQCRGRNKEAGLLELAESIQAKGMLQPPILLRRGDRYAVLVGFRRIEAARRLGDETVEAKVVEAATEAEALALGLHENLVREGLSPLEIAVALLRLNREFGWAYADITARLGFRPKTIRRYIAIAELASPIVRDYLGTGLLTCWQVLPILRLPAGEQEEIARRAGARRWSHREIARQVRDRLAATRATERARMLERIGPLPKYARITRAPNRNGRDLHLRFDRPEQLRDRLRTLWQCLAKSTRRRQLQPRGGDRREARKR